MTRKERKDREDTASMFLGMSLGFMGAMTLACCWYILDMTVYGPKAVDYSAVWLCLVDAAFGMGLLQAAVRVYKPLAKKKVAEG